MTRGFKFQLQTLTALTQIQVKNFRITSFQRNVKNRNSNVFKKTHQIFPHRNKSAIDEVGGRILLGDNTGGGRSCYGRSGSSVLEFRFQLDFILYTYRVDHKEAKLSVRLP